MDCNTDFSSCSNDSFLEFANDPNKPTSAPALILNRALFDIYENPTGSYARWNQYYLCNYNYYGNNEYSWTTNAFDFYTLKNVVKMIEENKRQVHRISMGTMPWPNSLKPIFHTA